jgi:hypothetical protein
VGFFPTALAVALVLLMLEMRAPTRPLSVTALQKAAHQLGVGGSILIVAAAAAISVTLQPLQFRLVQWCEGYWPLERKWVAGGPRAAYRLGMWRQLRRYNRTLDGLTINPLTANRPIALMRAQAAEEALRLRFPAQDRLLPTTLGNVLRAAEDRAALRYGIDSVTLWPRLFPLLPADYAGGIEDEVTQLDVSVRLVVTWLLGGVIGTFLLLRHPMQSIDHWPWAVFVASMFLLAQLSYRAAVESGLAHGRDVEVAIDLYRALVLDATRMPVPRRLSQERRTFAQLQALLSSYQSDAPTDLEYRRVP